MGRAIALGVAVQGGTYAGSVRGFRRGVGGLVIIVGGEIGRFVVVYVGEGVVVGIVKRVVGFGVVMARQVLKFKVVKGMVGLGGVGVLFVMMMLVG